MLKPCVFALSVLALSGAARLDAQQAAGGGQRASGPTPAIEERVNGLRKIDGYFPLYWDERAGTLLLEIPRFDTEFLFSTGLSAGLGSNDIGLDRGQGGQGRIVSFQRMGPRVMLVQGQQAFRSSAKNPLERKAVEDSFAKSVLWGFAVAAESNGRVLVDATDFFVRDVHGAGGRLRPGNYRVDRGRSAVYLPNTKGFPKNTEVDVMLTFVNEAGGGGGGFGGGPTQGPAPIAEPQVAGNFGRQGMFTHAGFRDAARARLVRGVAGQQLQAAARRPPCGLRRHRVRGLQPADRRIHSVPLRPPPPPGEEGPLRPDE
jgi:Domain of unknown function (DUF5117)